MCFNKDLVFDLCGKYVIFFDGDFDGDWFFMSILLCNRCVIIWVFKYRYLILICIIGFLYMVGVCEI